MKMSTAALLAHQFHGEEFYRYDIFMRYLMIDAIEKNDKELELFYEEMQEKRDGITEHQDLPALIDSMKTRGFLSRYPVPISKNGKLLGGAHRLACAHVFRC